MISYEIRKTRASTTGVRAKETIQSSDAAKSSAFFEVHSDEFTEFTWDGPEEEFPHEFVSFVGDENEAIDELRATLIANFGLPIPDIQSAGIPGKDEGWDRRLAFGPGNIVYFGVAEFSAETSTQIGTVAVPIALNAEQWWGADYFLGLKAISRVIREETPPDWWDNNDTFYQENYTEGYEPTEWYITALLHNGHLLYLSTGDVTFDPDVHSCELTIQRTYFTDGLAVTDETTSEVHEVSPTYSNLKELLVSRHQELTIFEWDGPAMLFPHGLVRIEGTGSDDLGVARVMLDPDFAAPIPEGLEAGIPSGDGWINRLVFGPDGMTYAGQLDESGQIVTTPIRTY